MLYRFLNLNKKAVETSFLVSLPSLDVLRVSTDLASDFHVSFCFGLRSHDQRLIHFIRSIKYVIAQL